MSMGLPLVAGTAGRRLSTTETTNRPEGCVAA